MSCTQARIAATGPGFIDHDVEVPVEQALDMTTFVLVHGGFGSSAELAPVIPEMEALGHERSYAPACGNVSRAAASAQCLEGMIYRLRQGDEPRLQELCRRFKNRVPSDKEAADLLSREDVYVWVADVEGELVGFTYAYVLSRIDGDTSVFLYELDVDEAFRRRGIGRALVDEARALAERVGALKMWVDTDYDNEAAKHTYAAAGGQPATQPTLVYGWRFR